MKKEILLLAGGLALSTSHAQVPVRSQEPPPVLTEILQHGEKIVPREEVSNAQREFLWKGKTLDRSGVIRVESTPDYIQLPEAILRHPSLTKLNDPTFVQDARPNEYVLVGKLDEGDERLNYVYKTGDSIVVLTVWPYQRQGVKSTRFEEMLTQSVHGVPAALSLSHAPGMKLVLWKMGWKKGGKSYELYLNDNVDSSGKPDKTPRLIVEIAETLSRQFE